MARMRIPRLAIVALAVAASLLPSARAGAVNPYTARKVVGRLDYVAAFTFAPDGRIFYAERGTGKIKIWQAGVGKSLFFAVPRVVNQTNSELGLLGLALHPSYPATPYLYAYATRVVDGRYRIQLIRIEDLGGVGGNLKVLWTDMSITAGGFHVGGRIMFGADGMLYVVLGERGDPRLAQDLDSPRGKILRMELSGDTVAVPSDNPLPGSFVYAYGIRNSYGFTFDPSTDRLWESENGPECNDELNLIEAGDNMAWGPTATCTTPPAPPRNTNRDGPKPRNLPLAYWTPTIAPTGVAFCDSCDLDANAEGALFFGAFNTGRITRVMLNVTRDGVEALRTVYAHDRQVLSMEAVPDGRLYFTDGTAIYRLEMPA